MSWTYLPQDNNGEPKYSKSELPPEGSAFLVFDALRWSVQLGYLERGGYQSILTPNVCDDCNWVAWAPLSETTEPDETMIRKCVPYMDGPAYKTDRQPVKLIR
jgi:hypothetical protein